VNRSRLLPARRALGGLLALLVLAGCTSSAPRIHLPSRTEANCESRNVKKTAIDAIVASTDDTVRAVRYPGDAALRADVKRNGGVFAYWTDQPFRAPDTAKALGVSGDLSLARAVISNQLQPGLQYRPVWLTFASPKGDVTVLERAYDVQNVCIEGRREL
jgi:hypothetical protein